MSLWGTYLEALLDVLFDGVSLQSVSGGQITNHNFEEFPEIASSRNSVASAHRSITAGRFFTGKRASVNIAVAGEFHELQATLARLRQLIQYKNKELVLKRGVPVLDDGDIDMTQTTDVTFRSANVVSVDMNQLGGRGTVITVEFTIDDPVGIGSNTQILLESTGVTSSSTSIDLSALELQGTFQEQYPVYEIDINSVTNGSDPSITITNGLSEIVISQSLAATDKLIIDTDPERMRVTLNGGLIDFSGSFPFIANRNSTIQISDTLTARNIDITVAFDPRYI